MTRIRKLVESILKEGWFGSDKNETRINDYVEEYLVRTFMRIYGLDKEFNQEEFENIKQVLAKEDPRFIQLDKKIEEILGVYERADVKVDMIANLLAKNGANMDIYDKALMTFEDEEAWKNPRAEMNSWDEWEKYQKEHGLLKDEEDQDQMSFEFNEDTVKQNGSWVNKGEEGTHGKFKTKKEADDQRKAMFANGYKG